MRARLLSLVAVGVALAPLTALAQEPAAGPQVYQGGLRPSYKDVYCAGFVSSTPLTSPLTIIAGEDTVGRIMYGQHEYVYLSQGSNGGVQAGQEYIVLRRVKDATKLQSFETQNRLLHQMGTVYQDVGRVRVHVAHETTATAHIVHVCDALQNGDFLVPFRERAVPDYQLERSFDRFAPFSGRAVATVVAARDFPALVGTGDTIYINLGTSQGVKVGDYVRLFRPATGTRYEGGKRGALGTRQGYEGQGVNYSPTKRTDLPREALGEAMIILVDANAATAVITYSVGEIHPGDYVELQPPAPPKASLSVEPRSIVRGQSAVLSWTTANSTEREVSPEVGGVDRAGTTRVAPAQTTTYRLTASGAGGSAEATTTLTVVAPPPPPPPPARVPEAEPRAAPAPAGPALDELFAQNVQDFFFDFNSSNIRPEARAALERTAQFLKAYPQVRVLIGGHCDEIGTADYNQRLGEHRAEAAKDVLVSLGVDASRISTVSHGKEKPFCTESAQEACRQLNRRAHLLQQ